MTVRASSRDPVQLAEGKCMGLTYLDSVCQSRASEILWSTCPDQIIKMTIPDRILAFLSNSLIYR